MSKEAIRFVKSRWKGAQPDGQAPVVGYCRTRRAN